MTHREVALSGGRAALVDLVDRHIELTVCTDQMAHSVVLSRCEARALAYEVILASQDIEAAPAGNGATPHLEGDS